MRNLIEGDLGMKESIYNVVIKSTKRKDRRRFGNEVSRNCIPKQPYLSRHQIIN